EPLVELPVLAPVLEVEAEVEADAVFEVVFEVEFEFEAEAELELELDAALPEVTPSPDDPPVGCGTVDPLPLIQRPASHSKRSLSPAGTNEHAEARVSSAIERRRIRY